jgi:hypothetical protein
MQGGEREREKESEIYSIDVHDKGSFERLHYTRTIN